MIRHIHKLPLGVRRKIALFIAGFITVLVFAFWINHSFGILESTYSETVSQGASLFGFLDQNVEIAYNAFDERYAKIKREVSPLFASKAINEASTTELSATSTVNN